MSLSKLPPGSRCNYCGKPASGWDHMVPKSKGGSDDRANLIPCCLKCNRKKGAQDLPIQFPLIKRQYPGVASTRIAVTPTELEALVMLKEHPRETHNDVLERLIAEHEAAKAPA